MTHFVTIRVFSKNWAPSLFPKHNYMIASKISKKFLGCIMRKAVYRLILFADLKQFWLFSMNEKLHCLSETNVMRNTWFKTFILIIVTLTPIPSSFEFSKFQILVQTYYSFRYSNQMNFGLQ